MDKRPRVRRWRVWGVLVGGVAVVVGGWLWYSSRPDYRARRLVEELRTGFTPGKSRSRLHRWRVRLGLRDRPPHEVMNDLRAIGEPATPHLLEATRDDNFDVRKCAICVLGGIRPVRPEVIPRLRELLKDDHGAIPYHAACALGAIGPPAAEAVDDLIVTLRHP